MNLFFLLKYLDFLHTLIDLVISPFFVIFTVFYAGRFSFILNGLTVLFLSLATTLKSSYLLTVAFVLTVYFDGSFKCDFNDFFYFCGSVNLCI